MDALADPDLPVRRRLLAGAPVGIGLDITNFAVSEMTNGFPGRSAVFCRYR